MKILLLLWVLAVVFLVLSDVCEGRRPNQKSRSSKRARRPSSRGSSRASKKKDSRRITRIVVRQRHQGLTNTDNPWQVRYSGIVLPGQARRRYGRPEHGQVQQRQSLDDLIAEVFGHNVNGVTPTVDNRPKPIQQPHSGEWIRLRGTGSYVNSGIVEVYRAGQWGVICDDGWDIKDGSVACRQLGFPGGAGSVDKGGESLSPSLWGQRPILMDEMQCTGSEGRVQECTYASQHDCTVDEAAALTCKLESGCPEGWFPGFGKCYKLYTKAKGIKMAGTICSQSNASLVNIGSAEENHFISNALKKSSPDIHYWYTGGKKSKNVWKWFRLIRRKQSRTRQQSKSRSPFRTKRSKVETAQWFPGWPSETTTHVEPIVKRKHDCLVLSDEFQHPERGTAKVDYFFWSAQPCRRRGGISFICQMDLKKKRKPSGKIDCYDGKGEEYRGEVQVTRNGTPCLPWSDSSSISGRTHPGKGLGSHNYCRNPDGEPSPWCWVNHYQRKFGFCDIPQCSDLPATTPAPVTTPAPDLNCPTNEFYCSQQRTCVPESFRCDNEEDCTFGEDEENCEYKLASFTKHEDSRLSPRSTSSEYSTVSYIGLSDERCAEKCLTTTDFLCRSFIYDSLNRSCELSEFNSRGGRIVNSLEYDYYEVTSQLDCSGQFVCNNGYCVDESVLCDGQDDCKDLSDEVNCGASGEEGDATVSVSLEGGEEHSGTVVLTYKGSTGVVCDDKWDLKDAQVICRMLGYRGAARSTVMNFFEYPPEQAVYMLDNVECLGTEDNILECPKNNWKQHDCKAYEIAGVVCQVSKVCETNQFKCQNELCVEARSVCDGVDDCGDRSDEKSCQVTNYRLLNGSRPSEGRVEVSRNGLWGTVCDDHWDDVDAGVLCRMLGFRYGGEAVTEGGFGSGEGPVWLDNVQCLGYEHGVNSCEHAGWAIHDCDHSEDAGAKCHLQPPTTVRTTTTTTTTTTRRTTERPTTTVRSTTESDVQVQVSLVGGSGPHEGTVELTVGGVKYRICDDYWEDHDAGVVCRMMGYPAGGMATEKSFFGTDNTPIILDNVECLGTETDLLDCKAVVGATKHDCTNDELAGVICNRLAGSTTPRVEVQTSPRTQTSGSCGQRPYDYLDLLGRRRRRSPITDYRRPSNSYISSSSDDDDLNAPRELAKAHVLKVVGGRFAEHGAYPWQVRVHKVLSISPTGSIYGSHHCGAVVISEYWLLSAAHCFYGRRKSEFRMVVGDHHQTQPDKGEQMFQVEELINHPRYVEDSKDYDIALIKVRPRNGRGVQFNNFVQPACLPDVNTPHTEGTRCYISGWGNTQSANRYPETLKAAEVPLISRSRCRYLYDPRRTGSYTERMMCAGYIQGGIDTCDGDSGGPLVCNINGHYTLLGLTSWGRGCAQPNSPGVYAKVVTFLQWIDQTIKMNSVTQEQREIPGRPS